MNASQVQGAVYWITGLSGSGKSTLAAAVRANLQARGRATILVDGDTVRELLLLDSRMDRESRLRIAQFNAKLCHFLSLQGLAVVCATISLFHSVHEWNRAHIDNYTEILLDTPLKVIENRDQRGLYARARGGEVLNIVGIDIAPEWPRAPHFTFSADGSTSAAVMAEIIQQELQRPTPALD